MEDKVIVNLNDQEIEINIIDIFFNPETGNELMTYTIDSLDAEEKLASHLIRNESGFILESISNDSDQQFLSNLENE